MEALKVCVCGAAEDQAPQLLQALVDGQIFGPSQPLHLTLTDAAERTGEVHEQVMDLRDAAYPLVDGVEAEMDFHRSVSQSDIILLFLHTPDLRDLTSVIGHYADALNNTPATKQKAVVVVSHHALMIAGLLCALIPSLAPRLVTAIQIPPTVLKYSVVGRGGHLLAKTVSEQVSLWWSALQMSDPVVKTTHLPNVVSVQTACLLPLVRGESAVVVEGMATGFTMADQRESEHFRQALHDLSDALKQLHVTDSQLLSSLLSCQL